MAAIRQGPLGVSLSLSPFTRWPTDGSARQSHSLALTSQTPQGPLHVVRDQRWLPERGFLSREPESGEAGAGFVSRTPSGAGACVLQGRDALCRPAQSECRDAQSECRPSRRQPCRPGLNTSLGLRDHGMGRANRAEDRCLECSRDLSTTFSCLRSIGSLNAHSEIQAGRPGARKVQSHASLQRVPVSRGRGWGPTCFPRPRGPQLTLFCNHRGLSPRKVRTEAPGICLPLSFLKESQADGEDQALFSQPAVAFHASPGSGRSLVLLPFHFCPWRLEAAVSSLSSGREGRSWKGVSSSVKTGQKPPVIMSRVAWTIRVGDGVHKF